MDPEDLLTTNLDPHCGYKVKHDGIDVVFVRPAPTRQGGWELVDCPDVVLPEPQARALLVAIARVLKEEVTVWQCCVCAKDPAQQAASERLRQRGVLVSHGICKAHLATLRSQHCTPRPI